MEEMFNDNELKESLHKYALTSYDDFSELLGILYKYKDDLPPQLFLGIFVIMGNLMQSIMEDACSESSFHETILNAQIKIMSDPRFEIIIQEMFPKALANMMFKDR